MEPPTLASPCRQENQVSRSSDLHLDADAVEGLIRAVEHTARRLWCHVNDETALTVPRLNGLDHVAIGWQLSAVRRVVVDRRLYRVEHEHGRPAMVMDRLLVVRFEGHLKNPE